MITNERRPYGHKNILFNMRYRGLDCCFCMHSNNEKK